MNIASTLTCKNNALENYLKCKFGAICSGYVENRPMKHLTTN